MSAGWPFVPEGRGGETLGRGFCCLEDKKHHMSCICVPLSVHHILFSFWGFWGSGAVILKKQLSTWANAHTNNEKKRKCKVGRLSGGFGSRLGPTPDNLTLLQKQMEKKGIFCIPETFGGGLCFG